MPISISNVSTWLRSIEGPGVLLWDTPVENAIQAVADWDANIIPTWQLRGWKMHDSDAFFTEFAAVLQYCGSKMSDNWNAFNQWFADCDLIQDRAGGALVILNADELLNGNETDAQGREKYLARRFHRTHEEYSEAVVLGNFQDRDPIPFHILLQHDNKDMSIWKNEGIDILAGTHVPTSLTHAKDEMAGTP